MSARVSPLLLRAGYFNTTWKSQWYSDSNYTLLLFEDNIIKQYLENYHYYLKIPSSNFIYKRFQHNVSYIYNLIYFPHFKDYDDLFLFNFKYYRLSTYIAQGLIPHLGNVKSSFFKFFIIKHSHQSTLRIQNLLVNFYYLLKLITKYQNLNFISRIILGGQGLYNTLTLRKLNVLKTKFILNLITNKFYSLSLIKLKLNKFSFFLKQKIKSAHFLKKIHSMEISKVYAQHLKRGKLRRSHLINLLTTQHAFSNYFTNDLLYDYDEYNSNFFFSFFKKNMIDLIKIHFNFYFAKKVRRFFYKKKKIKIKLHKLHKRKFFRKRIKLFFFFKKFKMYFTFLKSLNSAIYYNLDKLKASLKSNFFLNNFIYSYNVIYNSQLLNKLSIFNANLQYFNITKLFASFLMHNKFILYSLNRLISIKMKYSDKIKSIYYFFIMKYNFSKVKKIKFFKKKEHFFFQKGNRSSAVLPLFNVHNREYSRYLAYKVAQSIGDMKLVNCFFSFCQEYNNIAINYSKNNNALNSSYHFLPRFIESNLFFSSQFKSNFHLKKTLLNKKMSQYTRLVNFGSKKQTNIFHLKKQKKYKFNLTKLAYNKPHFKLIKLFRCRLESKFNVNNYSKNLLSLKEKNSKFLTLINSYNLFKLIKKTILLYKKYNASIRSLLCKIFNLKVRYLHLFQNNKKYNSYLKLKLKYQALYDLNIKLYKTYMRKFYFIYGILRSSFHLLKSNSLFKKISFSNLRFKKKSRALKLKLIKGRFFKSLSKLFNLKNIHFFFNHNYQFKFPSKLHSSDLNLLADKLIIKSYKQKKLAILFKKYSNSFFERLNSNHIKLKDKNADILNTLLHANIKHCLFNRFGHLALFFLGAISKKKINASQFLFIKKYTSLLNRNFIYFNYLEHFYQVYINTLHNARSNLFYNFKAKIFSFYQYNIIKKLGLSKYQYRNFKFNEDQLYLILKKYNDIFKGIVIPRMLSLKKLKIRSIKRAIQNLFNLMIKKASDTLIANINSSFFSSLFLDKKYNRKAQFLFIRNNRSYSFYNIKNTVKLKLFTLVHYLSNNKFNFILALKKQDRWTSFFLKLKQQFLSLDGNMQGDIRYFKYVNYLNILLVIENLIVHLNYFKNIIIFPKTSFSFLEKFNLLNITNINYIDFLKFKLITNIKIKIKIFFNFLFNYNKLQVLFYNLVSYSKALKIKYKNIISSTTSKNSLSVFKFNRVDNSFGQFFKSEILRLFATKLHIYSPHADSDLIYLKEMTTPISRFNLKLFFLRLHSFFLFYSRLKQMTTIKYNLLNANIDYLTHAISMANFKFYRFNLNIANNSKLTKVNIDKHVDLNNNLILKRINFLFFFSIYKSYTSFFLHRLIHVKNKYALLIHHILNNIKLNIKLKLSFIFRNLIQLTNSIGYLRSQNSMLVSFTFVMLTFFSRLKNIYFLSLGISNFVNSFLFFNNTPANLEIFNSLFSKYRMSSNKFNVIKSIIAPIYMKKRKKHAFYLKTTNKADKLSMNYKLLCKAYLKKLSQIRFKLMKLHKLYSLPINKEYMTTYTKTLAQLNSINQTKIRKLTKLMSTGTINKKKKILFIFKKKNLNCLLGLKLRKFKHNRFSHYVNNFLFNSFSSFNNSNIIKLVNLKSYFNKLVSMKNCHSESFIKSLQFKFQLIHHYLRYKKASGAFTLAKRNGSEALSYYQPKSKATKYRLKFKRKGFINLNFILKHSKKTKDSNSLNYKLLNALIRQLVVTNHHLTSISHKNNAVVLAFLTSYFNSFVSNPLVRSKVAILFNYYLFKFIYRKNALFKFKINNLLYSLSKPTAYQYLRPQAAKIVNKTNLIYLNINSFLNKKNLTNLLSFFFFKSYNRSPILSFKYRFDGIGDKAINCFKNETQIVKYNYTDKKINLKKTYKLTPRFYRYMKQRNFLKFNKIHSFYLNYNNNIYKINKNSPFFSYILKQDIYNLLYSQIKKQFYNFNGLPMSNISLLLFKLNHAIKLYKQQQGISQFLHVIYKQLSKRKISRYLLALVNSHMLKVNYKLYMLKCQLFFFLSKLILFKTPFSKLNDRVNKKKKVLSTHNFFFYKKRKYLSYLKANLGKKMKKKKELLFSRKRNSFFFNKNLFFFQFKRFFLNGFVEKKTNLIQSNVLKKKRSKIAFSRNAPRLFKHVPYFFRYKNKKKLINFQLDKYKFSSIPVFRTLYKKHKNIVSLNYKFLKYNKFNFKKLNHNYLSFLALKLKNVNYNNYCQLAFIKFNYLKYLSLLWDYLKIKKYRRVISAMKRKMNLKFNNYMSFIFNKMKKEGKLPKYTKTNFKGLKRGTKVKSNKLNNLLDQLLKSNKVGKSTFGNRKTLAPSSKGKFRALRTPSVFYYSKFKKLAKFKLKNNYFSIRSLSKYKLAYNNYTNFIKLKAHSFFLDYSHWSELINSLSQKSKYSINNKKSIFHHSKIMNFDVLINYIRFFIKSFFIFIMKTQKLDFKYKIKLVQYFKCLYVNLIKVYKYKLIKFNFSNQAVSYSYAFNQLTGFINNCNKIKNSCLGFIHNNVGLRKRNLNHLALNYQYFSNYSLFYLYLKNKIITLSSSANFKKIISLYVKKPLFSGIKNLTLKKRKKKISHALFNVIDSKQIYFKNKYRYLKLNNKYNKNYIYYLLSNLNSIYLKKKNIIHNYLSLNDVFAYTSRLRRVFGFNLNPFKLNNYYYYLKNKLIAKFKFNYYFNHFMYKSKVYYSKIKTKYKFQLIYNKLFSHLFKSLNKIVKALNLFFNINKIETLKTKKSKLLSFFFSLINLKSNAKYHRINKFFILIKKLINNHLTKGNSKFSLNHKMKKLSNLQNYFLSISYNHNSFSFNSKLIQFLFLFYNLQRNCNLIINNLFDKLHLVSSFSILEKQFAVYYYYYYYYYIYYYLTLNLSSIQNYLAYFLLAKYKNSKHFESHDLLSKNKYYLFFKLINQFFRSITYNLSAKYYKVVQFSDSFYGSNPNVALKTNMDLLENRKLSFIQLNYSVEHDLNKFSINNNNIFYFNNIYFYNYDYNFIFTLESKLLCEYIVYAFLSKKQYFEINDEIKEAMNDLHRFKITIKRSYDYLLFKLLNYYIDFLIDFYYFSLNTSNKAAIEFGSFTLLFNSKMKVIIQLLKSTFILISMMNNFNIKGVRIKYTGRQSRKVRADTKLFSRNKMALNCLVNRIDFYYKPVYIKYGAVGIKVFIYKENEYITPLYHLLFKGIITRVNTITNLINNFKL